MGAYMTKKGYITEPIGTFDTTSESGQWAIVAHHEPLLSTVQEAARRAAQQQRPVLASFIQPVTWSDTIRVFTAARLAGLGESFFWEQPAAQNALIGVGAATTIETQGGARFSTSASARRALLDDAVISCAASFTSTANSGPILFGCFTFDPLSPRTPLWADFPDGLLILPEILLSYNAHRVALTINRMVDASDDIECCVREIEARIGQWQAGMEQIPAVHNPTTHGELAIREMPPGEWMRMVANTVEMIQQGAFEKVVLARDIQITRNDAAGAFDISSILQQLRESYPTAYVFAIQRGEQFFVGATPELLVRAQDGRVHTMALAGSAQRGETAEEDAWIGTELLQSEKNKREHAIVVNMMQHALRNHCMNVDASAAPQLLKLKNVQHLETPITGELIPGRCVLDILADLHPTPAVGGFPREAALEVIRHVEKMDRGWYAAPIGWISESGSGEFAVALRSGLVHGNKARLFAGCGIVADSDPQNEFAESCLKFQAMLRALSDWNEG